MSTFRLLLLFFLAFACSVEGATTQPSNTVRAVQVIHFEAKPESERLRIVTQIARGQLDDSIYLVAGACVGMSQHGRDILSVSVNPATNEITVAVDLKKPEFNRDNDWAPAPSATEAAQGAVSALIQLLSPTVESQRDELQDSQQRFMSLAESLRKEIEGSTKNLWTSTHLVDVSSETILKLLSSLQSEYESVQLDLVGKEARADALTEQISKISADIKEKIKNDPVAEELEKASGFRQKAAEQLPANTADQNAALTVEAEARAKLLERREAAANSAGANMVADLNKELTMLFVEHEELSARSKTIGQRLSDLQGAVPTLDRLGEMQVQLVIANKSLSDLAPKLAQANRDAATYKVTFNTIYAHSDPVPSNSAK